MMKSQKFFSAALIAQLALGAFLLIPTAAHAKKADLLNQALSQSLQERDQVQKTYRTNEVVKRPDAAKKEAAVVSIEVGGEGSMHGGGNLAGRDEEKMEREDISKLDQEMKEVDRSFRENKSRNSRFEY